MYKMTTQKPYRFFLCLFCAVFVLSGCSRVQKELGLGRHSPDEFTVVKRAPLSLPPEYDLLPPDPENIRSQQLKNQNTERAEATVFGTDKTSSATGKSEKPEDILLGKAGAQYADPNIRKTLDRETGYVLLEEEKKITEKILFWQKDPSAEASLVNPKEEAKRIQDSQKDGQPLNEGDVPTIKKKTGTIDKFF